MSETAPAADDPFGDPRLVALYDDDNPAGQDHDFYRSLADQIDARTVLDLGCGTGLLAVALARPGRRVIGIDPSAAMLDYARGRPGGDTVAWRHGDAATLGHAEADLVIMTGNVAQHILDGAWHDTLRQVRSALKPGGTLAFESRNPSARAWESWTEERTRGTRGTNHGPLTEWLEVTRVADGTVTFDAHNVFEATGEHLVLTTTLAFRTPERFASNLAANGLAGQTVGGGWHGEPVTATSPVLVLTARRPAV